VDTQGIRLFIAIELPDELKSGLLQLQERIQSPELRFVKWVAPKGIHLTLKFLGNVAENRVHEICTVMQTTCEKIPPFVLRAGFLGAFPNLKQPRVLWVGITGDVHAVQALQKNIDEAMLSLGFSKENRPFNPHLTLARLRDMTSPSERRHFSELVSNIQFERQYEFHVKDVDLMRSQLLPSGAIYSCLGRFELMTNRV
jgi:2'-5' RNA ligase